jgi:hypothetical protein
MVTRPNPAVHSPSLPNGSVESHDRDCIEPTRTGRPTFILIRTAKRFPAGEPTAGTIGVPGPIGERVLVSVFQSLDVLGAG